MFINTDYVITRYKENGMDTRGSRLKLNFFLVHDKWLISRSLTQMLLSI